MVQDQQFATLPLLQPLLILPLLAVESPLYGRRLRDKAPWSGWTLYRPKGSLALPVELLQLPDVSWWGAGDRAGYQGQPGENRCA
jgi:hypothetical protein